MAWDVCSQARRMMGGNQLIEQCQQSCHPTFRGTRALNRGTLKRKSGRNIIHFTADSGNIQSIMRTIHSTNQLSIHGAVSSWCDELAEKTHDETSTGMNRSIQKKMIRYQNCSIRKKLVPWYEISQRQRESRETAVDIICKNSR